MPQKYVAGYLTSSTFINQSFNLLLIYITKGIRNYILSNLSLTNDKNNQIQNLALGGLNQ